MARKKGAEHQPDPRIYPAVAKDDFIASLLSQRDGIDAEIGNQPDLFKPALLNVVSALDTLADAVRTANNQRDDG